MSLAQTLQSLLDAECAKSNTHSVMLRLRSGDGRVDFHGSAGNATPDARYLIASITKMFTATVILQLVDEGQITLDQTVSSILTDVDLSDHHVLNGAAYGNMLTIRQLMHQTSGLADYFESDLIADLKQNKDRRYGLEDVLNTAKTLPPMAAPESGKSHYSDTNYQLLGAVIKTVTGQSFDEAVQARICGRIGMTETRDFTETDRVVPLYHKDQAIQVPLALSSMEADGGLVSTLEDMLVFLKAFMANQLFSTEHPAQKQPWNRLFFPLQYGYGTMRFRLPRWITLFRATPELIGHSGANGSFAFYAPDPDIYLVGSFNQLDAPQRPFGFMMRVLRIVAKQGRAG